LKSSDDFPVVILQPPTKTATKTEKRRVSQLLRSAGHGRMGSSEEISGLDLTSFLRHIHVVFFLTRIRITHKTSTNPNKTSFDITPNKFNKLISQCFAILMVQKNPVPSFPQRHCDARIGDYSSKEAGHPWCCFFDGKFGGSFLNTNRLPP